MTKKSRDEMSDRELLIRVDERLENMEARVNSHGNRLRAIEMSVVGSLLAIIAMGKDVIIKKIGVGP